MVENDCVTNSVRSTDADSSHVLSKLTELLYSQAPISNSVAVVIVLLFHFLLWGYVPSGYLVGWAALMITGAGVRLYLWQGYSRRRGTHGDAWWLQRYRIASALIGVAWSLIYPFVYLSQEPFVTASLMMLAFGVISSAVPILAPSISTFMLYTYPQGASLVGALLLFDSLQYTWTAAATLVYLAMMTLFTRNTHRSQIRSIMLEGENRTLIRDLNDENLRREQIISQRTRQLAEKNRALSTEVEERQRAEERLRQVNAELAATLQAIPDPLFELDNEGRYLQIWAHEKTPLAGRRESLLGNPVREILPPSAAEVVMQAIGQAGRKGYTSGQVIKLPLPQGEHWFELSTAIRPMEDGAPHFIMLSRDITDKHRIEQELELHRCNLEELVEQRTRELVEARDRAERLSQAKSEFLANMSHEIRTPLNAITGMAYLIRRNGLKREQAERMDKLEAAGEHLLSTIDSILELSKIESGKMELEQVSVRPAELVRNVMDMLRERASAKGLRLDIDIDDLPSGLLGDATRLQQSLLNYVNNAVKFTESGGVTVSVRVEEETADSVLIRFEVRDTGVGIAPDVIPRLFKNFEQADNSTTRRHGGTGLGLAITRRFAEMMGGAAGLQSTPGNGSTFWFTARLAKGGLPSGDSCPGEEEDLEQRLRNDFAGRRVLVAEDDPTNRELIVLMLEFVDLSVDTAEDGLEVLKLAGERRYDLVLMDVQMPNMDGLEATRAIRRLPDGGSVPILAITANVFAADRQRCYAAGMNDFISKPVKNDEMYRKLSEWIERDS